jgi:hypothetical protein
MAPDGSSGSVVADWYRWVGFLPTPFRVASLIVVVWVLIRLLLRYASRPLAALGRIVASGLVHLVTWLAIAPEYALSTVAIRYWDRSLPGSFTYGEAVANFQDAGERTATRVAARLTRLRLAPGKVAFWSIVIVLLIVNLAAYSGHTGLPVIAWWHSTTAWVHSLQHHAPTSTHSPPPVKHAQHHRHHHR